MSSKIRRTLAGSKACTRLSDDEKLEIEISRRGAREMQIFALAILVVWNEKRRGGGRERAKNRAESEMEINFWIIPSIRRIRSPYIHRREFAPYSSESARRRATRRKLIAREKRSRARNKSRRHAALESRSPICDLSGGGRETAAEMRMERERRAG